MADELLERVENRVGYLTFNRPDVRNALTPDLMGELAAALGRMERDPGVRAIVLTGTGRAFSSGADRSFLRALTAMTAAEIKDTVYTRFAGAAKALRLCAKPVIAAVNGPAIAAGCEVAILCDFRVVSRDAYFAETWIDIGIIPPLGGMYLLPRLIGLERASNMVLRAKRIGGEEAVAIGLATEVTDPGGLMAAATALAEDLAARSPAALSAARAGLRRGLESSLWHEWDINVQAQTALLNGDEFARAVTSIESGEKPTF